MAGPVDEDGASGLAASPGRSGGHGAQLSLMHENPGTTPEPRQRCPAPRLPLVPLHTENTAEVGPGQVAQVWVGEGADSQKLVLTTEREL